MSTFKSCRIYVSAILLCLLVSQPLLSQNSYWSSSSNLPGFSMPKKLIQQSGKGIWGVGSNGLFFIDDKAKKTTYYRNDDSGRVVKGLFDLVLVKDSIYAINQRELYKLRSDGKLQRVPIMDQGEYPQNWSGIWSDGERATVANTIFIAHIIPGVRPTKYSGISINSARVNRKDYKLRTGSFLMADIGMGWLMNSPNYEGLYVYDKKLKKEFKVATDNAVDAVLQKGKGLWVLGNRDLHFFSPDSIKPFKQAIPLDKDTTQKLVLDAKGNVFIYTSKQVYSVVLNDLILAGQSKSFTITPVTTRKSLPVKLYAGPLLMTGENDYYYAEVTGVYAQKGTTSTHLIKNLVPASTMTKSNIWTPDGTIYSVGSRADWVQYDGKQDVKKIEGIGYGQGFFTDGKKLYYTKGNVVYEKAAKGADKKLFEAPVPGTMLAYATSEGDIYCLANEGIGVYKKGNFSFTERKEIKGYPGNATHSIAVSPKNQFFIFASLPYTYDPETKTCTLSMKVASGYAMMYTTYFDKSGGAYSIGIGDGLYYDGKDWFDLKNTIKVKFGIDPYGYVGLSSLAVDYKGRCWLTATFKNEQHLLLLENGKIIDDITKNQLPLLESTDLTLYCKDKELMILSQSNGITLYKLN